MSVYSITVGFSQILYCRPFVTTLGDPFNIMKSFCPYSLDLLSIPQSGGKTVKTFRWDNRLQIQNLFMAFKRGSSMVVTLGQQYNVGEKPTVILYTYINHHAGRLEKQQKQKQCSTSIIKYGSNNMPLHRL